MKKLLLLLTVLCGISITSFAQSSNGAGKFSIGLEAGLPVGDVKNLSNFAIGGSLKYDHPIAENTFITGSAGYTKFLSNDDAKSIGYKIYAIPVKVGVKYFFDQGFYGEAQVGAAFVNESMLGVSGNTTTFAYSPGIGYSFGGGVDLGVRYEGWTKSGTTISQVAARLAYSF
ncbi:outer membrane beta-barrel protein [Mucilaginibacter phyllosphaerae]